MLRAQVTPRTNTRSGQDQEDTSMVQICFFGAFQDLGVGFTFSDLPFVLESGASVFLIHQIGTRVIIPTSPDCLWRLH